MGWFATFQAIKFGMGPYGRVKDSLKGEADPGRTLMVALDKIAQEIQAGRFEPDHTAASRISYWNKRIGREGVKDVTKRYPAWLEELTEEGYVCAGIYNDIDRSTLEDDPQFNRCDVCGGEMKYEGWIKTGSYRALAVCQNKKCRKTYEF